MGYLKNILIAVDQLGNAIAGGNPDCTISGRTGYYANHAVSLTRWYWMFMEYVINFTFYPVDGPNHCDDAYHNEENEDYIAPKGFMMVVLSLITIVACIPIATILYLIQLFKRIAIK